MYSYPITPEQLKVMWDALNTVINEADRLYKTPQWRAYEALTNYFNDEED